MTRANGAGAAFRDRTLYLAARPNNRRVHLTSLVAP